MEEKKRTFVMVEASKDEKVTYKETAQARGFGRVAPWLRWLALRDIRAVKKQDESKE